MKALLVNGSPRAKGCTYTALTELVKTLEAEGIETEIIHVGNKDARGCIACRKCHSTGSGKCVFDDIVNEVAQIGGGRRIRHWLSGVLCLPGWRRCVFPGSAVLQHAEHRQNNEGGSCGSFLPTGRKYGHL